MKSVLIALALCLLLTGWARPSTDPIAVTYGANFYGQEEWEPGKVRRWMSNNGEILVHNQGGNSETINLRFYAEAFQIPRDLSISVDGQLLAQWTIEPNAQRYIVIKAFVLAPGQHRVIFNTPQAALIPTTIGKGTDPRSLTVAFSPFSVIPANAPGAQLEWTGAFAAVPRGNRTSTPHEIIADDLRRQGRLPEAVLAYEAALAEGATDYSYLFYGVTLLALERRTDAMRALQQCSELPGWDFRRIWARGFCRKITEYLRDSVILSEPNLDPGRRVRAEGKIYEAVEMYQRTVAKTPDAVHANYWLGILNAVAERRKEAGYHFGRVVALVGNTTDGRFLQSIASYF